MQGFEGRQGTGCRRRMWKEGRPDRSTSHRTFPVHVSPWSPHADVRFRLILFRLSQVSEMTASHKKFGPDQPLKFRESLALVGNDRTEHPAVFEAEPARPDFLERLKPRGGYQRHFGTDPNSSLKGPERGWKAHSISE